MRKIKQKGFVLVFIITVIAVIGIYMFVLTGNSNIMIFQSNRAYLEAAQRNLAASGLAWAKKEIKNGNKENFGKPIELDITNIKAGSTALTVTITAASDKQAEVQIKTSCSRGRQKLNRSDAYQIELP